MPVSYTHLDVYKRQRYPGTPPQPPPDRARPVSYTHLDVYKRQLQAYEIELEPIVNEWWGCLLYTSPYVGY